MREHPMKTLRRIVAVLLSAAVCSGAAAAETVVWHSYTDREKAGIEAAAAAFNAKAETPVKLLAVPFDAYADKISAAIPRGKGPDVFIYPQDRLGGWVESGDTIEPLDFYLDDALTGRFLPRALDAMTYRESVYGLPLNFKAVALWFNKALVDAPPQTTGEMAELARRLTDADANTYGLVYEYYNVYYHAALMNALGGRVFDENGDPSLDSEENRRSILLAAEWAKGGFMPEEPNGALVESLFNEGKAAMMINGPWFLGTVADGVDFGVARLPVLDESGRPLTPWSTIEGVYVSAGAKDKDAAFAFADFLTSAAGALLMAKRGGQLPANSAAYDDPEVADAPHVGEFFAQFKESLPMPNLAEMSMIWTPYGNALKAGIRGSGLDEALARAQETVEKDVKALRESR